LGAAIQLKKLRMSEQTKERNNLWLLWAGLLVPPVVWALQMQLGYTMVPWACERHHRWPLHLITVIALLVALCGGYASWTVWSRLGPAWSNEMPGKKQTSRFMALLGLLITAMFSLTIIAQGIPSFVLHPCQP
jgi:hypothetical protein